MSQFRIDIHCHPHMKPYSKAHDFTPIMQQLNKDNKSSLWFRSDLKGIDKLLNNSLGLTKFSQSNLQVANEGNVQVVVFTLGCVERGFVQLKGIASLFNNLLTNLTSGFGVNRIEKLKNMDNYWNDFQKELAFVKECENKPIQINGKWNTYKLVKNYAEINNILANNVKPNVGSQSSKPFTVAVIPSVEGMHILNTGLGKPINEAEVMANAKSLKQMSNRPWFITFCHHFYNDLCGHARSFKGSMIDALDQTKGLNTGFTLVGEKLLKYLISDEDGGPIFIDLKHMSVEARKFYIELLKKPAYKNKIPLIISHGVANGINNSVENKGKQTGIGNTFFNVVKSKKGQYIDTNQINFYDDEILEMIRTKGIIGLQLDERRIANELTFNRLKKTPMEKDMIEVAYSGLLWNQIQYIAELADRRGLPAWEHIAIGSDYDGIIDPLNKFWTMSDYDKLEKYLVKHAQKFVDNGMQQMRDLNKNISAELIIKKIFQENAMNFFQRWYDK